MIELFVFYAFSLLLIGSSAFVIFSERPVKSALFLVLAFVSASVLWLLQYAEFLALLLIFVYVGAVMTLFLFVVMMLNVDRLPSGLNWKMRLSGVVGVAGVISLLAFIYSWMHPKASLSFSSAPAPAVEGSNSVALGKLIYTDYVIAFELVAFILLVAMIAAIVLVFRGPKEGTRTACVREQVAANKHERLQVIKVKGKS